jgi:hypothetical protein
VERYAAAHGLTGDDLSSAVARVEADLPEALQKRPDAVGMLQIAQEVPAVRVHVARTLAPRLGDSDFDGVPDRAAAALRVASRALSVARNLGLGAPADDGDGEVDLYLMDLAGVAQGYVALERPAPPGRGAAGFIVIDASEQQPRREALGMVARSVGRLVLAGRDATAPSWWAEPSAVWLESRVTGPPQDVEAWLAARWNHPERGLTVTDPVLARGNVALIWSVEGDERGDDLGERLLEAAWNRLARRPAEASPFEAVDQAARGATGLGLTGLQQRAAAARIARGTFPGRWGVRLQSGAGEAGDRLPVSPSGMALLRVLPPRAGGATAVTEIDLRALDGPWQATLLTRRLEGGWDRTRLSSVLDEGGDARFEVQIPWHDYRSAVLMLSRAAEADGTGSYEVDARAGPEDGYFALSSLSAVLVGTRTVELRWNTTREQGLFGWFVERARDPRGPWSRVGIAPLPSMGLDRAGSGYRAVDQGPAVGAGSFYRIVALTRDGLRISGPAVAVGR